jgi:hypothetical protein
MFTERKNNLSVILMMKQQFYINGNLVSLHIFYGNRDSAVSIATGYGLDD